MKFQRIISLILALTIILSLGISAFAEDIIARYAAEYQAALAQAQAQAEETQREYERMLRDLFNLEEAYKHYIRLSSDLERQAYLNSLPAEHHALLQEYIDRKALETTAEEAYHTAVNDALNDLGEDELEQFENIYQVYIDCYETYGQYADLSALNPLEQELVRNYVDGKKAAAEGLKDKSDTEKPEADDATEEELEGAEAKGKEEGASEDRFSFPRGGRQIVPETETEDKETEKKEASPAEGEEADSDEENEEDQPEEKSFLEGFAEFLFLGKSPAKGNQEKEEKLTEEEADEDEDEEKLEEEKDSDEEDVEEQEEDSSKEKEEKEDEEEQPAVQKMRKALLGSPSPNDEVKVSAATYTIAVGSPLSVTVSNIDSWAYGCRIEVHKGAFDYGSYPTYLTHRELNSNGTVTFSDMLFEDGQYSVNVGVYLTEEHDAWTSAATGMAGWQNITISGNIVTGINSASDPGVYHSQATFTCPSSITVGQPLSVTVSNLDSWAKGCQVTIWKGAYISSEFVAMQELETNGTVTFSETLFEEGDYSVSVSVYMDEAHTITTNAASGDSGFQNFTVSGARNPAPTITPSKTSFSTDENVVFSITLQKAGAEKIVWSIVRETENSMSHLSSGEITEIPTSGTISNISTWISSVGTATIKATAYYNGVASDTAAETITIYEPEREPGPDFTLQPTTIIGGKEYATISVTANGSEEIAYFVKSPDSDAFAQGEIAETVNGKANFSVTYPEEGNYTISCKAKYNGVWSEYGPEHVLTVKKEEDVYIIHDVESTISGAEPYEVDGVINELEYIVYVFEEVTLLATGKSHDTVNFCLNGNSVGSQPFTAGYATMPYTFTQLGDYTYYGDLLDNGRSVGHTIERIVHVVERPLIGSPTIICADSIKVNNDLDISWDSVGNAEKYLVYVGDTLIGEFDKNTTSTTIAGENFPESGDYTVKVVAKGKVEAEKSETKAVKASKDIASPKITNPANGSTIKETSTTLEWTKVEEAISYKVSLAVKNASGVYEKVWKAPNETVIVSNNTTSYPLENLISGKSYRVAVAAVIKDEDTDQEQDLWAECVFDVNTSNEPAIRSATLKAKGNTSFEGDKFIITVVTDSSVKKLTGKNNTGGKLDPNKPWSKTQNEDGTITWVREYIAEEAATNRYWTITAYDSDNKIIGTAKTNDIQIKKLNLKLDAPKTAKVGEKVIFTVSCDRPTGIVTVYAQDSFTGNKPVDLGTVNLAETKRTVEWTFSVAGKRTIYAELLDSNAKNSKKNVDIVIEEKGKTSQTTIDPSQTTSTGLTVSSEVQNVTPKNGTTAGEPTKGGKANWTQPTVYYLDYLGNNNNELHYGANQGHPFQAFETLSEAQKEKFRDIIWKNTGLYYRNDIGLQNYCKDFNDVGCSYAMLANVLAEYYMEYGEIEKFEKEFGYPFYDENGYINFDYMELDIYSYLNTDKGLHELDFTIDSNFSKICSYFEDHGLKLERSAHIAITPVDYLGWLLLTDEKKSNQSETIAVALSSSFLSTNIEILDSNGEWREDKLGLRGRGKHFVTITGYDEEEGVIYLSTWGKKAKMKLEDLTLTGNATVKLHLSKKEVSQEEYYKLLKKTKGNPLDDASVYNTVLTLLERSGMSENNAKKIIEKVNAAPATFRDLYLWSFFDYNRVIKNDKSQLAEDGKTMYVNDSGDNMVTWFHESGHAIDYNVNGNEFWSSRSENSKLNNDLYSAIEDYVWECVKKANPDLTDKQIRLIVNQIMGPDNAPTSTTETIEHKFGLFSVDVLNIPVPASLKDSGIQDIDNIWRQSLCSVAEKLSMHDMLDLRAGVHWNGAVLLNDMMSGYTNNTITVSDAGHKPNKKADWDHYDYWYDENGIQKDTQCAEAWAEYYSSVLTGTLLDENKELFDDACKDMDKMAEEMLKQYKQRHS